MGGDILDDFCVFANQVELAPDEVAVLKNICAEQEPTIPLYVCKMRRTNIVEGKGKMVSGSTSSLLVFVC